MLGLGAGEILIILAFALIFIGPSKLPQLAKNLGRGIREFERAKNDFKDDFITQNHEEKLVGLKENHSSPLDPSLQDTLEKQPPPSNKV